MSIVLDSLRNLSDAPLIQYAPVGLTCAHIWYDTGAIDALNEDDIANLEAKIPWMTNQGVLVRTDKALYGMIELDVAPDYAANQPEKYQQMLDYVTKLLRAAAPGYPDYQADRSQLEPDFVLGETEPED